MTFTIQVAAPPEAIRGAMTAPPPLPAAIEIGASPTGSTITLVPEIGAGGPLARLATPPEQCHGVFRFSWIIRQPGGRFLSATGFWDKP